LRLTERAGESIVGPVHALRRQAGGT
jgi:hypothetical protein